MLEITKRKDGNTVILKGIGRIDTNTSENYEKALFEVLEEADDICLDFEEIEFISSAGLRVLLMAQKRVNSDGKEMILRNINETVEDVLESTGFIDILVVE